MNLRIASGITSDSIVDGPGLRAVIWCQGCFHNCPGCHNPQTHSPEGGRLVAAAEVIEKISALKIHQGITFSGGEPFLQATALVPIAEAAHRRGLDVWSYSGYTFEELLQDPRPGCVELLRNIDVLVDGRFIAELRDLSLRFRGSSNQRIIDVPASLAAGRAIEI